MTRINTRASSWYRADKGAVLAVVLGLAAPSSALAQAFQSYGLNFVTVGDPGNRGATAAEAPLWPTWAPPLGAVDHTYGIMRTNVTNAQWIEFVRAYAPYYAGNPGSQLLTGEGIFYTGTVGGAPQYAVGTGQGDYSAQTSWRVMARYCNWLHNGKSMDPGAFENGAYDTSTFGEVVVGGTTMLTDQFTHHPKARYWIPTVNEYTKAGYWDPDKLGPGQGGYWIMPDGGDERLVAGPPGVGEAAGDWLPFPHLINVESYPETQSPWGLMDISSTMYQHTEGLQHPSGRIFRLAKGSEPGAHYWVADRLDYSIEISPGSIHGFRIATSLPTPATVVGLVVGISVVNRRFRHVNVPESVGRCALGRVHGQ